MLLLGPAQLRQTDIADHALQALTSSRIREVVILGRRGPAQASFTAPELLELLDQNHFEVVIENAEAHAAAPGASAGEALRMRLLNEIQARAWPATQRRLVLRFLAPPLEIAGSDIGSASCRERVCQYVYISVVAVSL